MSAKLHDCGLSAGPKLQSSCYFAAGHHGGSEYR